MRKLDPILWQWPVAAVAAWLVWLGLFRLVWWALG